MITQDHPMDHKRIEANARLIAQSPAMLEILIKILSQKKLAYWGDGKTRDIIEAATGKTWEELTNENHQ